MCGLPPGGSLHQPGAALPARRVELAHGAERLAAAGPRAWVVWLRTILGAVAANLVLRAAALAVFDIPPEFEPLAVAGPTVFLTVVRSGAPFRAAGTCPV